MLRINYTNIITVISHKTEIIHSSLVSNKESCVMLVRDKVVAMGLCQLCQHNMYNR